MKIMVETSARHIHVTKEVFATLFGADATLTKKKDLSQPGQFACAEKVKVVGPKGEMMMSILGPERSATQVEVALTVQENSALPLLFVSQAILQVHRVANLSVLSVSVKLSAV